jgi:hypothetical protein
VDVNTPPLFRRLLVAAGSHSGANAVDAGIRAEIARSVPFGISHVVHMANPKSRRVHR